MKHVGWAVKDEKGNFYNWTWRFTKKESIKEFMEEVIYGTHSYEGKNFVKSKREFVWRTWLKRGYRCEKIYVKKIKEGK